jgi:hypothetical protein
MNVRAPAWIAAVVLLAALAGCKDKVPVASTVDGRAGDTSVLGAPSANPGSTASSIPRDARGREIPAPPLPGNVKAQVVASGPENALAVWLQDGEVMAAAYTRGYGWSPAQALERIHGDASAPRLASNGRGDAMAVWQHTVGRIESLRFSRFQQGTGWSVPDVVPGALPRPVGQAEPPTLRMTASGEAFASWPSGFAADEMQTSRFVAGQGWSRAEGERMAVAPGRRASAAAGLP